MITLANRIASDRKSGAGIARGWVGIFKNSLSLAGLQLQLLKLDAKEWLGRSTAAITTLAIGGLLVMAATPVLLAAAVVGLTLAGLELIWALLIVGGVALILGGLLVLGAISSLQSSISAFDRSHRELNNNLTWLNDQFPSRHE
ncbi:MAG: phage holin family protein [Pirellulaceae bacterium]